MSADPEGVRATAPDIAYIERQFGTTVVAAGASGCLSLLAGWTERVTREGGSREDGSSEALEDGPRDFRQSGDFLQQSPKDQRTPNEWRCESAS